MLRSVILLAIAVWIIILASNAAFHAMIFRPSITLSMSGHASAKVGALLTISSVILCTAIAPLPIGYVGLSRPSHSAEPAALITAISIIWSLLPKPVVSVSKNTYWSLVMIW